MKPGTTLTEAQCTKAFSGSHYTVAEFTALDAGGKPPR
jgi:hypothetical protein